METIGKYKIYEVASRLPMMSTEEMDALRDSIRTQGLMHPIVVADNDPLLVIDGRNRLKACLELETEPRFVKLGDVIDRSSETRELTWMTDEKTGLRKGEASGDPALLIESFIIMENVLRRQLPDFARYKQLTALKGKAKQGAPKGSKNASKNKDAKNAALISTPTIADIATDLKVSERKVQQMAELDAKAEPEIKQELIDNKITVGGAYKKMKEVKAKNVPMAKKSDWFDQNTDNDFDAFALRTWVMTMRTIERQFGIAYLNDYALIIRKIFNDGITHLNYEEKWKQDQSGDLV